MMIRAPVKTLSCPSCGAALRAGVIVYCDSCGCELVVSRVYVLTLLGCSVVVTILLTVAFAPVSVWLLVWWPLWLLISRVMFTVSAYLFPPAIEVTGSVRGIIYGDPRRNLRQEDPAARERPTADPTPKSSADRQMFAVHQQPWTLEGLAIGVGLIAFGAYWLWGLMAPSVYEVFPWSIHLEAPHGFPVTVDIDGDALAITNWSDSPWTCEVVLANDRHLSGVFAVGARGTRALTNRDFANPFAESAHLGVAALRSISLGCREPSGIVHGHQWFGP